MKLKRWLGIGLLAAAIIAAIVYGFRPQPVPVELAEVKRGPMRVTVEEEGKTRVTDRFVISAPVAGFARRIPLEVGDAVKEGQVVATIEPSRAAALDTRSRAEAQARVSAAEASLAAAEERVRSAAADVAYWEGRLSRVRALFKSGDMPQETVDQATTEYSRAEAAHKAAVHTVETVKGELRAARAAVEYSAATAADGPPELVTVRSPVSGRVLAVTRKSEGAVLPGLALIELANAQSLEVVVELLSADAVRIAPQTRVLFERWGGDRPLEGRVRLIEPTAFTKVSALGVEEQRVRVIVDFTSPRSLWTRLGDAYRVEAAFVLWESNDVLQLPASALFRYQDGWAAFHYDNGFARRRPVQVDHRNGVAAEVLGGLNAGDKVVLYPDDTVADGKQIAERSVSQ